MANIVGLLLGAVLRVFRTRRALLLENLRQQLAVLKPKRPTGESIALQTKLMIFSFLVRDCSDARQHLKQRV